MDRRTTYSIFGTGYYVKMFDKSHPLYVKLKSIPNVDVNEYTSNIRSVESLGLKDENGRVYQTFFEIKPSKAFYVYNTDVYTRLEIRQEKNTKIKKVFFHNLIRNDYLFPPEYMLRENILVNEGLLVLENDKGNFGSTTHGRVFYALEQLKFEIVCIPEINKKLVGTIYMEEFEVKLKNPDVLNFGVQAFLI